MARDSEDPPLVGNPIWKDLVLVPKFDREGNIKRWTLSSTRMTREAAFDYLTRVAAVDLPLRRGKERLRAETSAGRPCQAWARAARSRRKTSTIWLTGLSTRQIASTPKLNP
jgi:hypothetical protein